MQEMMVNTTIEAAKSRARGPSITEQRAAEEAAEMAKAAAKAAAKKRTGKQSTVRDAVAQTLVACAAVAGGAPLAACALGRGRAARMSHSYRVSFGPSGLLAVMGGKFRAHREGRR